MPENRAFRGYVCVHSRIPGAPVDHSPTLGSPGARALMTRRGRLKALLATREDGFSLKDLQEIMEAKRGSLLDDLRHLQLSLRHTPETLLMVPPGCLECGFTFRMEEPRAPSRCPKCKGVKLTEPIFKVDAPSPASAHGAERVQA